MTVPPAIMLGLRLALSPTGRGRWRSTMLALAALVGTVTLLTALAYAQAASQPLASQEVPVVPQGVVSQTRQFATVGAVVLTVLLPVTVLSATAGRLSSALRERRLAGLRLLGMTPAQVRATAATETGVVASVGWALGVLLFLALLPVLADVPVAGTRFSVAELGPGLAGHALVAAAVPGVAVLLSVARRRPSSQVLSTAREAVTTRVGWWRVLPLLAGVPLCLFARAPGTAEVRVGAMLAGAALLGLGMLLVLPAFVRLVADLLLRVHRPSATIAARRLQAQPTAMTRVLASLLIGLFLVTGARAVGVAFESVPQYAIPHHHATVEADSAVAVDGDPGETARRLSAVEGVRHAIPVSYVVLGCRVDQDLPTCDYSAIVASCDQLQVLAPEITACAEDRPRWLTSERGLGLEPGPVEVFDLRAHDALVRGELMPPMASVPHPADGSEISEATVSRLNAPVFLPAALVPELSDQPASGILVLADPMPDLTARLTDAGFMVTSAWDMDAYESTRGLLDVLRIVSVVVLGIGILSFGIAALDRSVERRREVMGLQLVGVPGRVLRRSQWLEIGLPLTAGCLLALGLGQFTGQTFLDVGHPGEELTIPAGFIWPLTIGALAGSLLVAGLTSLAANPRIRPELIRTE